MGVVFLTADGRTVYANRAAEEIFRSSDGLFFQNGTICASDRRADADLRELIRQALAPIPAANIAAIQVPRHSLRRAYQCVAPPFRKRLPQFIGTPGPVAVVLISDPEQQQPIETAVLADLYSLTPKEAALTASLSEGKTIHQAAREMAMSYETARTHLRRIFDKTATSRQSELLLLIAQLPRQTVPAAPDMLQLST
jgi:DNA-binding CsgD family transcriptional regulator